MPDFKILGGQIDPGDVLMDATTIISAGQFLSEGIHSQDSIRKLHNLIQLVQAIVLYERGFIEPLSIDHHGYLIFSRRLWQGYNGFICQLPEPADSLFHGRAFQTDQHELANRQAKELTQSSSLNTIRRIVTAGHLDQISVETIRGDTIYRMTDAGHSNEILRTLAKESNTTMVSDEEKRLREIFTNLAYRSFLNCNISYQLDIPYVPSVDRTPFIAHAIRTRFMYKKIMEAGMNVVVDTATIANHQRNKMLHQNLFRLDFPPIFNYVLSKAKSSWKEIIPLALELRESREAKSFRDIISATAQLTRDGELNELGKLLNELNSQAKSWLQDSDEQRISIEVAFPLGVSFDPMKLIQYLKTKRKHYLIFLDRLYRSSITSSNLWTKINSLNPEDKSNYKLNVSPRS